MGVPRDQLSPAQQETIARVCRESGATQYLAERDEDHDAHVFVRFFDRFSNEIGEEVIEGDGSIEEETISKFPTVIGAGGMPYSPNGMAGDGEVA